MDYNIVVLAGRLAAEPELRELDSGARLLRYLVTTRITNPRKRIDVVPVVLWDPPEALVDAAPPAGERVWAYGAVHRRFWERDGRRRSRVEIVASHVCIGREPDAQPFTGPPDDAIDAGGHETTADGPGA